LDPTLIQTVDVTQGLKFRGTVLLNMKGSLTEVQRFRKFRLGLIDAGEIAVKNGLGTPTNPIVNTTILGAFSRFSGLVKLESILSAIEEEAPFNPEANINAAKEAYQRVTFLNE
jgi:Pyruvate/2-oxoacid:ferredoxin oxidoreductase gamma subunit